MSDNNQTYKADNGKTRLDLVSPTFIEAVGKIRTFGVSKYGDSDSWAKVEPQRYMAALLRHINAYRMGEETDKESGLPHLWHAACNLMFLIDLDEHRKSGDIQLTAETLEIDDEIIEEFNATFPEVINNITAGMNKIADFLAKYNELSEAQQEADTPPKENKCCLNCLLLGECEDLHNKTVVNGCCDKWQSYKL